MRAEITGIRQSLAEPIPLAHALQEGGTKGMFPGIQDVPVHIRGSYTRLGEVVPRRFPEVLAGENQPPIKEGSGRKELAEWIANPANPLTARVMVNRIWQGHFGEGIVRTANNFVTLGTPPTHPELLDHLATALVKNNWRLKPLHRQIMLSAAYQADSVFDPVRAAADPDNQLFWRHPLRRLEAEAIRDAILAVSGMLEEKMYGPGTLDPASKRRSVYFTVKRSNLIPMMVVFDAPEALTPMGERSTTTIAPQALLLMNNPQVREYAKALAKRAAPTEGAPIASAIRAAYEIALSRSQTKEEQSDGVAFVAEQVNGYTAAGQAPAAVGSGGAAGSSVARSPLSWP